MKKIIQILVIIFVILIPIILSSCSRDDVYDQDIYFDICDYVTFEVRTSQENLPITVSYNVNGHGENLLTIYDTLFVASRWGCIGDHCFVSAQNLPVNVYTDIDDVIDVRIYFHYPVENQTYLISQNADYTLVETNVSLEFNLFNW